MVLYIEGEDLLDYKGNKFKNWYDYAYKQIINNDYDYVFGNYQVFNGDKIGCSLLLCNSSIIQHLLYYTDSDTTHINPFIQLSLADKTKFCFYKFYYIKESKLENIHNRFSFNLDCPSTNDIFNPSFCILLPAFKRNYFSQIFSAFSNQTYKPKFYLFIQNDNRRHFNFTLFQNIVKEPIYHIWIQNFNSFFFLIHRFASILPCDFIIKYDDDEWPLDNALHEKLINKMKNQNLLIGGRGYFVNKSFRCYSPTNWSEIQQGIVVDHMATPFISRTGYFKLDARNKIYSLYHAEDVALSVNSLKLCNVTSIYLGMRIIQNHGDGNNKEADEKNKLIYQKDKFIFQNSYRYLINSGYKPIKWSKQEFNNNDRINIMITHKSLNRN